MTCSEFCRFLDTCYCSCYSFSSFDEVGGSGEGDEVICEPFAASP